MLSEYVDFREALNEVQKLYACALYKCESNNRDCVEKLTLEYKAYQKNLEKRYLAIPDLSEPDDQWINFEDIIHAAPQATIQCHALNEDSLPDKMTGAIIGRLSGCILGVPVESWSSDDIHDMAMQFGDSFPPTNYWSNVYYPSRFLHHGWAKKSEYTRLGMNEAPVDDDTGFTILDLLVLEKYRADFQTSDIANIWKEHLPFAHTAEDIALKNIKEGLPIQDIAIDGNPYTEWIGGYIRSDGWAWSCPGNPRKAAEFAWRDAFLTHRKNGMYGEIFFSAVEAAAFTEDSIDDLIKNGLQYIPQNCRLAKDVRWVLSQKNNVRTWRDAVELVTQRFQGMARVHTNNNACLVLFGLFLGKKDLTKTIGTVVAMGYDTDCNAATAGSIIGAIIGKSSIEEKWYLPFHGVVKTYIKGQERLSIDELSERYLIQANLLQQKGQ